MTPDLPLAVELRGLTKQFGAVLANASVNLRVEAGTIQGVIGENGAGKTTAMNLLPPPVCSFVQRDPHRQPPYSPWKGKLSAKGKLKSHPNGCWSTLKGWRNTLPLVLSLPLHILPGRDPLATGPNKRAARTFRKEPRAGSPTNL